MLILSVRITKNWKTSLHDGVVLPLVYEHYIDYDKYCEHIYGVTYPSLAL